MCRQAGSSGASGSKQGQGQQGRQLGLSGVVAAPASLQLLDPVSLGDAGAVVRAVYQGTPAFLKLFGPDSHASAAF